MSLTSTVTVVPAQVASVTSSVGSGKSVENKLRSRYHIPWPSTKEEHRQWQLEQMAGAFHVFAKLGFADGGSGHISLRG
jgi:hypothetical protein